MAQPIKYAMKGLMYMADVCRDKSSPLFRPSEDISDITNTTVLTKDNFTCKDLAATTSKDYVTMIGGATYRNYSSEAANALNRVCFNFKYPLEILADNGKQNFESNSKQNNETVTLEKVIVTKNKTEVVVKDSSKETRLPITSLKNFIAPRSCLPTFLNCDRKNKNIENDENKEVQLTKNTQNNIITMLDVERDISVVISIKEIKDFIDDKIEVTKQIQFTLI